MLGAITMKQITRKVWADVPEVHFVLGVSKQLPMMIKMRKLQFQGYNADEHRLNGGVRVLSSLILCSLLSFVLVLFSSVLSLSLFLLHFVPLPFNWRLEVPSPPRSISVPVWAAPWADSSRHLVGRNGPERMQGGLIVILNYKPPPNRHDGRHESRSQPL